MAFTWVIVKDVGKFADVTDQHDRNDISRKEKKDEDKTTKKLKLLLPPL